MTVSTTGSRDVKQGNGTTTNFPTSFEFFEETTLRVVLVDSNGNETLQSLGADYSVSGGGGDTGTVSMNVAPASTEQLVIERVTPRTQTLDLAANDFLPAGALEEQDDRLVHIVQELADDIQRAALLPVEFAATRPVLDKPDQGKLLIWDGSGNLVNTDLSEIDTSQAVISNYAATLLDDANASTARQTLGLDQAGNNVNADTLDGQEGSWYADIPARLGFTPPDKANADITFKVGLSATFGGAVDLGDGGDNDTLEVRGRTNSGAGFLKLGSAGDRFGFNGQEYVIGGSPIRTQADSAGWRRVNKFSIPTGQSEFVIPLPTSVPNGISRIRIWMVGWSKDAASEPIMLFQRGGTDYTGSNLYSVSTWAQRNGGSGATGRNSHPHIEMAEWGDGSPVGPVGWPMDGQIEVYHNFTDVNWTRVFGVYTTAREDTPPFNPHEVHFNGMLDETTSANSTGPFGDIDGLKIKSDNGENTVANWTGGTVIVEVLEAL